MIDILMAYQFLMFLIYAIPDAKAWVDDKRVNKLPVLFEASRFLLARPFGIAAGIKEKKFNPAV